MRYQLAQRVRVRSVSGKSLRYPAPGVVITLCFSGDAWVQLDARLSGDEDICHPFGAADTQGRERWVLIGPQDAEAAP